MLFVLTGCATGGYAAVEAAAVIDSTVVTIRTIRMP